MDRGQGRKRTFIVRVLAKGQARQSSSEVKVQAKGQGRQRTITKSGNNPRSGNGESEYRSNIEHFGKTTIIQQGVKRECPFKQEVPCCDAMGRQNSSVHWPYKQQRTRMHALESRWGLEQTESSRRGEAGHPHGRIHDRASSHGDGPQHGS